MSEEKHTPPPWNLYDLGHGGCYIGTSERPSVTQSICVVGNVKEGKADGRFILKAVNSHDQLVEALKGVGEYVAAVVHYATMEQAKDWGKKHLEHIGEALKAAGEEV